MDDGAWGRELPPVPHGAAWLRGLRSVPVLLGAVAAAGFVSMALVSSLPTRIAALAAPPAAQPARAIAQELSRGLPAGLRSEIQRRANALLDDHPVPGLAVGVVLGDTLAYAAGFGVSDRATGAAVTPATLFQIGSVTKPLTAALAGMLVDRGRLSWNDELRAHLWDPDSAPDSSLTVGQLAAHTSGLPGQPPTLRREHDDAPILAFTHVELYASLRATRLEFRPGTDWAYSNFGYAVLGHVLERVSGRPFETMLASEILDPLGMTSTTMTLWPELDERLATPYYHDEETGDLTEYTPWDPEALSPAGGLTSSIEDLTRFARFMLRARSGGEDRLAAKTVRELQSIHWRFSDDGGYGMGWFVEEREGVGEVLFHGGGVDGYSAWLALAPDQDAAVVVLVNSGEGSPIVELTDWILARLAEERRGR